MSTGFALPKIEDEEAGAGRGLSSLSVDWGVSNGLLLGCNCNLGLSLGVSVNAIKYFAPHIIVNL